ncbi:hypothetical protein Rhe02_17300 [Rhizocola hellebori]|uniref:Lipoprotein n=1 Tax=Rhizocola hellebori TaxID=1392758 RepID=A0A8J3Q495_9ACTN|nr:hypothetical protein [Rhizocola hellebori]GIH03663.1 hypothetical protein Rhe02_17300 [Rhizocola hellebori]
MSHLGFARSLSLVAVAALVLSACGSKSDDPVKQGPVVVDGAVDMPALQRMVDTQRARSKELQEIELARLDNVLERGLWTESGLESALGGAAAADAAFDAHGKALTSKARAIGDLPMVIKPVLYVADPTIGEGMFGGAIVAFLGADRAVSASNEFTDGQGSMDLGKEMNISGSRGHVDMVLDATHESHGVTTRLIVKIGISPCPDANGRFEASAKVDVSVTKSGGSTGQKGTLDLAITGQADDDAKLASTDTEYRMQFADFANSKGGFVEVSGAMGDTKVRSATLTRSGGKANSSMQESAVGFGSLFSMIVASSVALAAEKGWQSGNCVSLKPTVSPGPKGMKPGATSTINAAPRSRIDGGPVGGSVKATLAGGGASVKPDGSKVNADATFTYTAPDAPDKTGTVALEARSRRGVAKASIDFDTKRGGYVASGGTQVKVSGTVNDLTAPFTLQGKGTGFDVVYSYTPASGTGGTYTYTGSGSGVSMQGSGTYQIAGSDPVLTLTQTGNGCVTMGGCSTTTNVITLTRAGA